MAGKPELWVMTGFSTLWDRGQEVYTILQQHDKPGK